MDRFERPAELSVEVDRVRLPGLDSGLVLVDGEPYSGIGFVPNGDEYCFEPVRVFDGLVQGVSDDPVVSAGVVVELTAQPGYSRHRQSGHTLHGKPFTGSSIKFGHGPSSNRVVELELVESGHVVDSYRFLTTGQVFDRSVFIELDAENELELASIAQTLRWSRNGSNYMSSTGLRFRDGTSVSGSVESPNATELSSVSVSAGYFDALQRFGDRLVMPCRLRNLDSLDYFDPHDDEVSLTLGDRPVELASKLVATGLLEQVAVLRVQNLLGQQFRGLEVLFDAEFPELRVVVVEDSLQVDFSELLVPLTTLMRRHPRVTAELEGLSIHRIRNLHGRKEPAFPMTSLYFDEEMEDVVGVQCCEHVPSLVVELVSKSRSLRFIRCSREADEGAWAGLASVRPDVVVYGSAFNDTEWVDLALRRLQDDGLV